MAGRCGRSGRPDTRQAVIAIASMAVVVVTASLALAGTSGLFSSRDDTCSDA